MADVENTADSLQSTETVLGGLTEETGQEDIVPIEEAFVETDENEEAAEEGATEGEAETEESAPQEEAHVTKPQSMKVRMQAYETKGYKRGKEEAAASWAEEKAKYEARIAEYEQREMEAQLKEEAAKLAKEEHVSEAFALRLLRAEKGLKPQAEPAAEEPEPKPGKAEQPRDKSGRFTAAKPQEQNDEILQTLFRDAQTIESVTGINVEELLDAASDADKQALSNGSMSMADFVRKSQKKAPQAVRSTNSSGAAATTIGGMSDAAFEQLQKQLASGKRYRLT